MHYKGSNIVFFLLIVSVVCIIPNKMLSSQNLEADWEILRNRPYPDWFKDAKLGVFIHWGVYSVPAYGGAESYAEWYLRGLQAGAQNRIDFMKKNFGDDFVYEDFAPLFKAELFDPDEWAAIFQKAGAKYIVLVAKHHDGFCLWPSSQAPGWNSLDTGPKRDIVGELAEAVRKKKLRFGLYYSLPEWNHPLHRWYNDPPDSIHRYVNEHMIPQFTDLISSYLPDLIFTDGEWFNTADDWHAKHLIAWYYNLVGPDAIVNDRWGHGADIGFITPEYSAGEIKTDRPWAEVRGLGRSFGLNRNEKLSAYMSNTELIHLFIKSVANGGGLIINVGPAADGKIPLLQQERIETLGAWIAQNEEAIYGATTWQQPAIYKDVSLSRTDTLMQFNWVRNSPGKPISEDNFSVVWEGFIRPDATEKYLFKAQADDGMRLFINNIPVINQWNMPSEGTDSEAMRDAKSEEAQASVLLKKNVYYPIRIEFYETIQNASLKVEWESKSRKSEVLGKRNLYTSDTLQHGNGLKAVYRSKQQTIAFTRNRGNLYVVCLDWPGDQLKLEISTPKSGTQISLLGREGELPWKHENGQLIIQLSNIPYHEIPNHHAWTFKIEGYDQQ